jgi:hypothetical protein
MKRTLSIIVLLISITRIYAQQKLPAELKEMKARLELVSMLTYDYTITRKMPDATVNSTKGKVIKTDDFFSEVNSQQQVIQTKKWYYQVDHANKSIFIIDLVKVKNNVFKGKMTEKPEFLVPDSILLRYGKIDIKKAGPMEKITISFTEGTAVEQVYIEYDSRKKIPVLFRMKTRMVADSDGWKQETGWIEQTMSINKFSYTANMKAGDIGEYFAFDNGKVRLKKYTGYKLIQRT